MKTFKYYFLVTVLTWVCLSCSEDPIAEESVNKGTLTGKVVEDGTNTPLENVKISTNPQSSTVFTDTEGNFSIDEILVGQYAVQAELDGYLATFESADINTGITTNVIFELEVETANNQPPSIPELISPSDNATDVPLNIELVWSASDPEGDDITYNVELRNDVDDEILAFEIENDTTLQVTDLKFGRKYFWQVGAKDDVNEDIIQSQISSFETILLPENRFLFVRKIGTKNVIFSSDEEGNEIQLTSSNDNSYRPRRNIVANKIAYLSNNGSQTHIFTMNLDGSGVEQITSAVPVNGFDLEKLDFAWANNGGQIYYANFDTLYSINSNGTNLQEVYQTVDGSFISEVVISADESIIVLKTNNSNGYGVRIFTIDDAGNEIEDILSGVNGAAGGLDISFNNSKILYWYDVSEVENPSYRQLDSRVFLYTRATQDIEDLSDGKEDGFLDYDCRFSPNEAQVIVTNTSNDGLSQKNIILIDIELGLGVDNRSELFQNARMPDYE